MSTYGPAPRAQLIQYIIENKQHCGKLATYTPDEIHAWAEGHTRAFLIGIFLGAYRRKLVLAGLNPPVLTYPLSTE